MFKQRYVLRAPEGGEGSGGEGGDDGSNEPEITPEVKALIDSAVAEATKGLKNTNAAIKLEKKELSEKLKAFDGIDPEAIGAILKRFADDEESSLIKEGKIDEVLNKRTQRMKAEADKRVSTAEDALKKASERSQRLVAKAIDREVMAAASEAGIHKHAIEDAVIRARSMFQLDDEDNVIAAEDITNVNGEPLTLKEWFTDMKEKAPHWFPASASGGGASGSGTHHPSKGDFGGSQKERLAAIRSKYPGLQS